MSRSKPIAVTIGDPAGIGPEIILKAFANSPADMSGCFVVGDFAAMERAKGFLKAAGIAPLALKKISSVSEFDTAGSAVSVLQVDDFELPAMSKISAEAGRVAGRSVEWAARAALRGDISAIVTAPLNKESLRAAGFKYPGHTELLQAEAAAYAGCSIEAMPVRMMLANDELRTVLVSIHMSLRNAIDAVTYENVLATLRVTSHSLTRMLERKPRIGVAGLNPHAGEGGLMGAEEISIIEPAVRAAVAEGIDAHGPFAPDTIFMRTRSDSGTGKPGEFDVVIAMYHDQGLIPVKYLGVDKGVNVTVGLPLVRTSPDHGTAFDIAGKGLASEASLVEAVRMARRLVAGPDVD